MAFHVIQSGVGANTDGRWQVLVASSGRLLTFYEKSTDVLAVAYSDDGGLNWTEVTTAISATLDCIDGAIDGNDVLHLIYKKTASAEIHVRYRTFENGAFTAEETVTEPYTGQIRSLDIAIDEDNFPHIVWHKDVGSSDDVIYYANRITGSWSTSLILGNTGDTGIPSHCRLAIAPNGYIYVVWRDRANKRLRYVRYTSFWLADTVLYTDGTSTILYPELVIDTNNNVHVVWYGSNPAGINYMKYSQLGSSWSVPVSIENTLSVGTTAEIRLGIDSGDNLYVIFGANYIMMYTNAWSTPAQFLGASYAVEGIQSPYYPRLLGKSSQRPAAGTYLSAFFPAQTYGYFASGPADPQGELQLQTPLTPNDYGVLPTYSQSIVSAVARVQQNVAFPQFVIGGRNSGTYKLFKKGTTYDFTLWRSPVQQVGNNFDILEVKFPLIPEMSAGMSIIPVLYFDNEETSSPGATINVANYPNSDKLIILSSKNFNNIVHGKSNFFLELQITGSVLTVPGLPITFELEVEDLK